MVRTKKPLKRTRKPHNPTGCVGKYREEFADIAHDLVGKLGLRNSDLAMYFNVNITTLEQWCQRYPAFNNALKRARYICAQRVGESLYQKAIGYEMKDIKFFEHKGMIIEKEYTRKFPPDIQAATRYLNIILRDIWSSTDSIHHTHSVSGEVNHNHRDIQEIPVHELSQQEREMLFTLNLKQLKEPQKN